MHPRRAALSASSAAGAWEPWLRVTRQMRTDALCAPARRVTIFAWHDQRRLYSTSIGTTSRLLGRSLTPARRGAPRQARGTAWPARWGGTSPKPLLRRGEQRVLLRRCLVGTASQQHPLRIPPRPRAGHPAKEDERCVIRNSFKRPSFGRLRTSALSEVERAPVAPRPVGDESRGGQSDSPVKARRLADIRIDRRP